MAAFVKIYLILLLEIIIYLFTELKGLDIDYTTCYRVNMICLIICTIIFFSYIFKKKGDVFSPIFIFTILYVFMFFITPMYDIYNKNYLWFGVNLFDYGVKGSLIALLGYISFYFFYINGSNQKNDNKNIKEILNKKNHQIFIFLGYFICLLANIFYLMKNNGNSILYVLTLGALGSGGINEKLSNIGLISMLSYCLPSFTLLYLEYGRKNKIVKFIIFMIMLELQVARGFRFFIIQIAIMFGFYYFLRNNRKIKFSSIIIFGMLLMIPIFLMTLFRNSIRSGEGIDLSIISFEILQEAFDAAFWENLRIYKTYYGIIKAVPKMTDYLFGKQMIIYTMIMFIPRAIWKEKPGNPGIKAQELGINEVAVKSGSAYPCLGEYYYECGILGVIFCMSFFGWGMKNLQNKYRFEAKSKVDLMIYTTIVGTILQLVIRGYTPSNFWMIIFSMLPFWIMKKFFMRKIKYEQINKKLYV